MSTANSSSSVRRLVLILAGLTALTPFSVDLYLPAIPVMAASFGVHFSQIETSVSLFLLGLGFGQLLGGPWSDKYGRRRMIFVGLSIFIVAILGVLLSQHIQQLWFFRGLQGLGGGIAVVNSPAVVRDISSGAQSAQHQSRISTVMMMAPMVAPLFGMLILSVFHWRAIFVFLLCYSLMQGFLVFRFLPETRKKEAVLLSFLQRYWLIISHRKALAYIFGTAGGYGALFAFVTGSPSLYIGYFGVSETVYPFLFAISVFTLILINQANIRLLRHFPPQQLFLVFQFIQLAATSLLLLYVYFMPEHSLVVVVSLIVMCVSVHGSLTANGMACTTDYFPKNAATAAAFIGAIGFMVGGVSGVIVGILSDDTAMPVALVMFGMCATGCVLRYGLSRGERQV